MAHNVLRSVRCVLHSSILRILILAIASLLPIGAEAQSWTTLIDDTFTGPDYSNLTAHVPETNLPGGTWAPGGSPYLMLQGDAVRPSDYGPFQAFATIDARVSDGDFGLYWYPVSNGDDSLLSGGLIFRYVNDQNFMLVHYSQQRVWLWKMEAGSLVHIAYADVANPIGSWHWMAVRAIGSSLAVNWDGVDVITVTNSTYQTATRHGVWWWNSKDTRSYVGTFRVRSMSPMQPPAVASIATSPAPLTIPIATSATVTATGYSATSVIVPTATFTWSSSDPAVAWIDSTTQNTARIVGGGVGTATITVTAQSGSATSSKTITATVTNTTAQARHLLINDEFIAPEGSALIAHRPETNIPNGSWSLGGTQSVVVYNQAVRPSAAGAADTYATIDSRSSDANVGLYWLPSSVGDQSQLAGGVIFRYASPTSYFLLHYWQEQLWLWKMTPSGFVNLANVAIAPPYNAWHWMEIRGTGPDLTVNWDGVDKMQFSDSTNQLATRHGIWWRSVTDPYSTIGTFTVMGTLPEPIASVTVTPASHEIPVTGAKFFNAAAYAAGGTYIPTTFTWTTSNADVATVQSTGLNTGKVTGVAAGTANITATAPGGASFTVPVTIVAKCLGLCVADQFTGAGLLPSHTPDTNVMTSPWEVVGGPTLTVATDRLRPTGPAGGSVVLGTINGGNSNGTISAEWTPVLGGETPVPSFGLLARYSSNEQYYLALYENARVKLFRRYPGGIAEIGNAAVTDNLSIHHTMQVKLDGPGIQVWWDGVQMIQAVESMNVDATRHGVYWNVANDPSSSIDNFIFVGTNQSVPVTVRLSQTTGAVAQGYPLFVDASAYTAANDWIPWASFTWSSSDSGVAVVETLDRDSARIVGYSSGSTDITATSSDGLTATIHVLVSVTESAATVRVYDTFNGLQHTLLSNHEPNVHPTGTSWAISGPDSIQLNDLNEIYPLRHTVFEIGTIESSTANGTVSANWRPYNSNSYSNGGVVFRYVNDNSFWYALVFQHGLYLKRVTGSAHETVASVGVGDPTNGIHQIAVLLDGSRIQVWWNGVLQIEYSDGMNQTATRHGVIWHSAFDGASSLDKFSVNSEFITPVRPDQPVLPCVNGVWPPTGQDWPAAGGSDTVTLSAPFGCHWQASTTVSWIHLATNSGVDDAYVGYTVEPNTGTERTGEILFGNWSFPIRQAVAGRPGCVYGFSVSPAGPVPAFGGYATINIATSLGCEWSVGVNSEFVTIEGASHGWGPSRVDFGIGANSGATGRIGSVTIAGRSISILQGGTGDLGAVCADVPPPNPNDPEPDDEAINCLLKLGGVVTLSAGAPGYIIAEGLHLSVSGVTLKGDGLGFPRLIADPWLNAPMLRSHEGVNGYRIEGLVFDGNRQNRQLKSEICVHDYQTRTHGYNLQLRGTGFTINNIFSNSALCGSAMEVFSEGGEFSITNNGFYDNGFQESENFSKDLEPWSDGLTLLHCDGGQINHNLFEDNTDVDLIVGEGHGCQVLVNSIRHRTRYGYAGLMVGFSGDHSGSLVQSNSVTSGLNLIGIGLMIGQHPWEKEEDLPGSTLIHAGSINNNSINGAVRLLWIDGIEAGVISENQFLNRQGNKPMFGCQLTPGYAAHHYGIASIQADFDSIRFDSGQCVRQP